MYQSQAIEIEIEFKNILPTRRPTAQLTAASVDPSLLASFTMAKFQKDKR